MTGPSAPQSDDNPQDAVPTRASTDAVLQPEAQGTLDEHGRFVLGIDDASRVGHSLLGIGSLLWVVLVIWLSGTPVWSVRSLWLAPLSALLGLVLGRRLLLARQDARLRQRVRGYCEAADVEWSTLVSEAERQGRYEFFVKLFARSLSPGPAGQKRE